jgi:hypothetical protein
MNWIKILSCFILVWIAVSDYEVNGQTTKKLITTTEIPTTTTKKPLTTTKKLITTTEIPTTTTTIQNCLPSVNSTCSK